MLPKKRLRREITPGLVLTITLPLNKVTLDVLADPEIASILGIYNLGSKYRTATRRRYSLLLLLVICC